LAPTHPSETGGHPPASKVDQAQAAAQDAVGDGVAAGDVQHEHGVAAGGGGVHGGGLNSTCCGGLGHQVCSNAGVWHITPGGTHHDGVPACMCTMMGTGQCKEPPKPDALCVFFGCKLVNSEAQDECPTAPARGTGRRHMTPTGQSTQERVCDTSKQQPHGPTSLHTQAHARNISANTPSAGVCTVHWRQVATAHVLHGMLKGLHHWGRA
jgi:hypothetical protein